MRRVKNPHGPGAPAVRPRPLSDVAGGVAGRADTQHTPFVPVIMHCLRHGFGSMGNSAPSMREKVRKVIYTSTRGFVFNGFGTMASSCYFKRTTSCVLAHQYANGLVSEHFV